MPVTTQLEIIIKLFQNNVKTLYPLYPLQYQYVYSYVGKN